ncbi:MULTISPECIES: hypothetical protein [unclassified Sphingomonas]|uniref:hypothetical protein n=1 Tax=unclassified Sphingomonas TaxID=196159 RepID=UPI0006FE1185|nr:MULTISPECIES: hypothetical protein [unclassified Sphingomonas]KQM66835.1 hypothetical protein ASE65_01780 [Sphingomonas sp. Leaf16]KQN17783.1 hypothetical protein ASE81_01160 [Sphingomonas sp. Leaf29]KQN23645.1 hypothetical protein ASE83_04040 [Sphingomonas sp. Leaf32]
MRFRTSFLTLLILAGCSQAPDHASEQAAPGVDVTAAPGVAFSYRYGFRLPAARIAAVQEAHAAACERFGVARCRITAMRYTRSEDNDISAMLGFSLAPDLARSFGRDGIRGVEAAEGMLLDSEITGEDAGARIDQLAQTRDAAAADRAAIDGRSGTTSREARAELERQRAAATGSEREAAAAIAEQRAALAATPVVFEYRAGQAIRGFDPASPFTRAADLSVASARWTIGTVLALLGLALPPLLLVLFGLLLWRRVRHLLPMRVPHAG